MPAYDDDFCLQRYRALCVSEPDLFHNPSACPTRILLDSHEIQEAQRSVCAERAAGGWPTNDLRVGLLAEDHYMGYVIRDAVRFSDNRLGLYNRVVATGGIVVLPVLGDSIALIRIFRHAARRWFLEAPQGFTTPEADLTEEVRRELMEEMGASAREVIPLGKIYTSTALTSENLKMFAARIESIGAPQRSEGIESIRLVKRDELDELIGDGTICDGPTTSIVTHARLRGVI